MLIFMLSLLGMPTFQKSKCKKLLETTVVRIQHLKGRHEVQRKQYLDDLFKLVERGNNPKAADRAAERINRIWKETSVITVFTKIQEYCDTVRINLSNIAGQKECPVDLEEPVATLCYAASCFGELPELQEIRDIFAVKYRCGLGASAADEKRDPHVNKEIVSALSTEGPSEDDRKKLLTGITNKKYKLNPSNDNGTSDDGGSRRNGSDSCNDILTEVELMQKKQFKEIDMVRYERDDRQDIQLNEVEAKLLADGRPMKKMPSTKQVRDSQFKRYHRRHSRRRIDEEANNGDVNNMNQMQNGYVHNGSVMISNYNQQPRTPRRVAHPDNYQLQAVSNRYGPPQRAPPPPPLMNPSPKPALPPPSHPPPPLPSTSINRVASLPNFQNLSKQPSPPRSTTLEDHERRAKQGIYVHPKLPDYDELVAQFKKKSNLSE